MVLPLYRQCTAAVNIQSIPSFLTCYGRSNMNACIPSMTRHSRFSWIALLFISIHSYIKFLHYQMFTCMFAADERRLSVFQYVNSLAMHLNMSLRLPGSPQSLPDGTVAQNSQLKFFITHTSKVSERNQHRLNVQVHCLFLCSWFPWSWLKYLRVKRKYKYSSESVSRPYFGVTY